MTEFIPANSNPLVRALNRAQLAILDLDCRGVDVLGLESAEPRPVIAVRDGAAARRLGGYLAWAVRVEAGVRECWLADHMGCLIKWTVDVPRLEVVHG
jgi:hypothetical protein